MKILNTIIEHKKAEVEASKKQRPLPLIQPAENLYQKGNSLVDFINENEGIHIIAEFKRKSPSKGIINAAISLEECIQQYQANGAAAISVLTDEHFFGGSLNDLITARKCTSLPLLRKDFIIDTYQIYDAKAAGADIILLIAAVLSVQQIKAFSRIAKELQLEVLLEIHNEAELDCICDTVDIVGINNRNLQSFEVNLEHPIRLAEKVDNRFIRIAESGIRSADDITMLKASGFHGFLIGETLMQSANPGKTLSSLNKKSTKSYEN